MLVTITLFLITVVGFFASQYNRGALVAVIAIIGSSLFGLIDPLNLAIKGVFDHHAIFALIFSLILVANLGRLRELKMARFSSLVIIYLCYWLYGVLFPVINGYSSLFWSLKASKEFLMFLAYYGIFYFVRTPASIQLAWKILVVWGIYYSVIEILLQALGPALATNLKYFFRPEPPFFWKLYPPFWPVILLVFLYAYFSLTTGYRKSLGVISISLLGVVLTFFRAYLLATFVSVPVLLFWAKQGVGKTLLRVSLLTALGISGFIFISFSLGDGFKSFEKIVDDFVLSGIREISSQEGGSLAHRAIYAEERQAILNQSPWFGFGFIEKQSAFGQSVKGQITGDMLSFVDKGDIDLKLKFGEIGFYFINLTYIFFIYKAIKLLRNYRISRMLKARILSVTALMMIYLLVQPVHSALSHSFGLLPLFIALGLVDRQIVIEYRQGKAKHENYQPD